MCRSCPFVTVDCLGDKYFDMQIWIMFGVSIVLSPHQSYATGGYAARMIVSSIRQVPLAAVIMGPRVLLY